MSEVGLEVVEGPGQPPRPRPDRAPLVGVGTGLSLSIEERVDAVLKPIVEVGIDVPVVGGHQRVAPGDDGLHRPAARPAAPAGVGGPVVLHPGSVGKPRLRQADPGVRVDRVVPPEVQAQKRGHRARRRRRHEDEQVHHRRIRSVREEDPDLAPGGSSVERAAPGRRPRSASRRQCPGLGRRPGSGRARGSRGVASRARSRRRPTSRPRVTRRSGNGRSPTRDSS